MSLLEVQDVEVRHGLLRAVRSVSLELDRGETLALVGANGAGKTSLLRAIAGATAISAGRIAVDATDISERKVFARARAGIALVPEGRRLFADLTVRENLVLAADFGRPGHWTLSTVVDAFPVIAEHLGRRAGNLSGGQQQAVAIARGLITNPLILLLDEVSLGLAPVAVDDVYASLAQVLSVGDTAVILVEQDVERALAACSRVACMLEGRIVLEGATRAVRRDQVVEAYFGLGQTARVDG